MTSFFMYQVIAKRMPNTENVTPNVKGIIPKKNDKREKAMPVPLIVNPIALGSNLTPP